MTGIYDTMLELPLFQGLSVERFTSLIAKVPVAFAQYRDGESVMEAGERVEEVCFVLSGTVRVTKQVCGESVVVQQDFEGPYTVPFHSMFGAETRMDATIQAVGEVGVMRIGKGNFLDMVQSERIVLIHVMNMLSTSSQRHLHSLNCFGVNDPLLKMAAWLLSVTGQKATRIKVLASDDTLQQLLNISAPDYEGALFQLQMDGYVRRDADGLVLADRYGLKRYVNSRI